METAYKDFQKRLNGYVDDSKDLQKKYLLQASIDRLDKKAGAYLDYKNNQMLNKEIDVKIVKDKAGAVKEMIPTNSKTLQRMKLAAKIREDMSKQREFYADKKAELANDKKPQSV